MIESRRVHRKHLVKFNWLAVSGIRGYEGAWCADCVMFQDTTHCVTRPFVSRPLTTFRKVMGRDGAYETHQKSSIHKKCRSKSTEFLNRIYLFIYLLHVSNISTEQ